MLPDSKSQAKVPNVVDKYATALDPSWMTMARRYESNGMLNPELFRILCIQTDLEAVGGSKFWYDLIKGLLGRFTALVLLILCLPLAIPVALFIKATSRGPIFYQQVRIGRYMTPFRMFKFRTMTVDAEQVISFVDNEQTGGLFKNRSDPRITLAGRALRRWSIDELPQLLNVLRGDMSLVGPRPLPAADTATVQPEYYLRFAVKPGMTGMWQVYAREVGDGRIKIKLDCDYVAQRGFALDIKLLALTIPRVFSGKGAY